MGRSEPKLFSQPRGSDRVSNGRGEINRSQLSSKLWFSVSSESSSLFPRDCGIRSLSRTEWEERCKKGLCFRCGQQYGPSHKCPEGKLRVLLLGDDEYDPHRGECFSIGLDSPVEEEASHDSVVGTCISLDFEGVLIVHGGANTLKFEGMLHGISIYILVDSGASHDFVSRCLVSALGLPSAAFHGLNIKLGDGHVVFVSEQCVSDPC